jgi:hypothetical protein
MKIPDKKIKDEIKENKEIARRLKELKLKKIKPLTREEIIRDISEMEKSSKS